MKILRNFICSVLIVILSVAFVGCGGNDQPQLSTPQNVAVSDTGEITWDAVENADYYIVVLNGFNMRSNTNSYTVGSVVNDFTYAIIARSDNGYLASAPTETYTFEGKGVPVVIDPLVQNLTVSITGNQLVGSEKSTQLTATVNYPDGNVGTKVTWAVVDGAQYGSIDGNGKFTAAAVTSDHDVTVRATSTENSEKYAELVICVACQPEITDEMMNTVKDDYISFEGYMDIDLYTFEIFERFVRTVTVTGISTQMNGDRWHASYVDGNTGYTADIHYKNEDGKAQQVALSLMNDEEYYLMTDEAGNPVSWADAGLYNNFGSLSKDDFTFDETDWRYYYDGSDAELMQKMVSSASPYEFTPERFGLIIEDGELLGIYAESKPDYSVVQGYKAIQKLYSFINCGEDNVDVPLITKFEHNPLTTSGGNIDHDTLDTAIKNMQALESYTLDFTLSSHMATGYTVGGFIETVVEGDYYFEPYDMTIVNNVEYVTMQKGGQYGFHKISDDVYNSYTYDAKTDTYDPSRAFEGDMTNAKASFAFASEIFTAWQTGTINEKEANIYYVDESMCTVASTFYYGVGNDMPLYGLFAMRYDMLADYTPYVVVQDGYIIETGFFYFLGDMYGEVRVRYSDFNTAELPDTFKSFDGYVPRIPPTDWTQLTIIDETFYGDGNEVNAFDFFADMFGSEDAVATLPFFNELLGDTYGFGLATYRKPGGTNQSVPTVILYYDVPLEADRTIDGAIKSAQEFLVQHGFVKNSYGEYVNGSVSAMPYDSSLDFWIYVWKTV